MPSSEKTQRLRLNKWSGGDKPKREDFNSDNSIIDSALGGHMADAGAHLSADEKKRISVIHQAGSYFGTGESEKTVPLAFAPKAVLVFAQNRAFTWTDSGGKTTACAAAAIPSQHTLGVQISGSGFKVSNSESAVQTEQNVSLNKSGLTYFYIAFA